MGSPRDFILSAFSFLACCLYSVAQKEKTLTHLIKDELCLSNEEVIASAHDASKEPSCIIYRTVRRTSERGKIL